MTATAKIGETAQYWVHSVDAFPSPVAQFRMAQLIDHDDRLYETARIVYRFLVGWYHEGHGDALLSQRHVAKVMKQRAPEGAAIPSRNAVQRAIIALMDTGWVVRSYQGRGKGRGASRYVPVMNVLEVAAQGKFPELAHTNGPVTASYQPAHANGPVVAHAIGPVEGGPAHANGPKTLLPDPRTDAGTGKREERDCAVPVAPLADGLEATAAAPTQGFEELWRAYGYKRDKARARAEFGKLEVDVGSLIASATAWRAAWAAQGKADAPRMGLATWLRDEHWDEEPPTAFKPKERKPKPAPAQSPVITAPAPSVAANENRSFYNCAPASFAAGEYLAEVLSSAVDRFDGRETLLLTLLALADGAHAYAPLKLNLAWASPVEGEMATARSIMTGMCAAMGIPEPRDTEVLHDRPFKLHVGDDGAVDFSAAPLRTPAETECA